MNKKILFAAVGAALAVAPMISAQAEVKVGGLAHLSLDSLDGDATGDVGSMFLSNNSSNINISASEDLGGGLKAIAKMEFLYEMDTNQAIKTAKAGRDAYVGLKGGFGTVLAGQYNDPVKNVGRSVDLFYNEQLGESRAIVAQTNWDARMANSIGYKSNDMGGLKFEVQYGVEDSYTSDFTTLAAALYFKSGPLYVAAGYKKIEGTTDLTGTRLVGSYNMGAIKFTAFYQDVDVNATTDRTSLGLGIAFKSGNNTFKAQWYQADETTSGANDGASQTSLGIDHSLSKNTVIYATYAKTSNDASATFGVGGSGHGASVTPASGTDASGFSLGMRMKF